MQTASGGDNRRVIKARLTSGEIIVLEKDCGCCDEIHIGPHWLHMNDFDRATNVLDIHVANQRFDVALLHHAGAREVQRLTEKGAYLKRLNIAEIIRPDAAGAAT